MILYYLMAFIKHKGNKNTSLDHNDVAGWEARGGEPTLFLFYA